jgi:hypothetical protein
VVTATQAAVTLSLFLRDQHLYRLAHQLTWLVTEQLLGMLIGKPNASFLVGNDRGIGRHVQDLAYSLSRQRNSVHWVFEQRF